MRRKNLLKELGIQKQADTSCNALDIDTENIRQRVYAKLDFADTERKQTTMRSKKKILPLLIAATLTIGATAVAATGKISMWTGSSASRADYTSLPTAGDIIATINGTNLYYVHYINKVVSDDYELTEQDKKDQASGKVVFSYDGSASQIEVSQVQSVNWNKDGIQYDLLQIDGQLSADELADMAREVINNRR